MKNCIIVDINENDIYERDKKLLEILLFDRTSRKNIIWGTDDYSGLGPGYTASDEIKQELITGRNSKVIQPRITKEINQKEERTKTRAEVFTPSWICNAQNNLIDDQWFNRKNIFNMMNGDNWETTVDKIMFPERGLKTWKKYVDTKRLEITCGEAPYLASRYDAVTGQAIPVKDRIGLLDRKLRVVNENTNTLEEWKKWAKRAVESVYGYEFQGDNLLLARENILYTYVEHYQYRFGEDPDIKDLKEIAFVISWNIWQMDGFNYAIPYCEVKNGPTQMTIFDFMPDDDNIDLNELYDTKGQALCKIRDWRSKETVLFKNIVGDKRK